MRDRRRCLLAPDECDQIAKAIGADREEAILSGEAAESIQKAVRIETRTDEAWQVGKPRPSGGLAS